VDLLSFGGVKVSLTFSLSALYYNRFRVLLNFPFLSEWVEPPKNSVK
jgi:hypothetical protein